MASQDVRFNSARLTKSELFAKRMGNLDCLFQARLPNGKIIREPGRLVEVMGRTVGDFKTLARATFCVRIKADEVGTESDLDKIYQGVNDKN